jgi:hypothetical protein
LFVPPFTIGSVPVKLIVLAAPRALKPVHVIFPEQPIDVVATFANVFTPEKYGIFPTTAADEVESPPKLSAFPLIPLTIIGQVGIRVEIYVVVSTERVPFDEVFTKPADEKLSRRRMFADAAVRAVVEAYLMVVEAAVE